MRGGSGTRGPLAKACRFQIVVRLDHLAQAVFGSAVTAIGVRMMAFHQHFELRLDVGPCGAEIDAERIERLAFGVADHPAFALGAVALRPPAATAPELAENTERVGGRAESMVVVMATGIGPQFPCRPMAGDGILLEPGH